MTETNKRTNQGSTLLLTVLGIVILAGAIVGGVLFIKFKPKAKRKRPPRMSPSVEVQVMTPITTQVVVKAMGTVVPAVSITLQARVTGEIVGTHPQFREGGIVKKGETLVTVDDRDYRLALTQGLSQVAMALGELKLEEGQQDIARHEWTLQDKKEEIPETDRALALRHPQRAMKQAALRAAEVGVEKARLNLERTRVSAPCSAVIQSADVRQGDLATPQTRLATLIGTDTYWVRAAVPLDRLSWLDFPVEERPGSEVRIVGQTGTVRTGRLLARLSNLEPQGRMAQVLVEIKDPLNLANGDTPQDPLLLDEYVRVEIKGKEVRDVFQVPRSSLKDGKEVWLLTATNTLSMKSVTPAWNDRTSVLLKEGMQNGDKLIVSDLSSPVDGMTLRVVGEPVPESKHPALGTDRSEGPAKRRKGDHR